MLRNALASGYDSTTIVDRLTTCLAAPPYRDYVGDAYNLRSCQCRKDWVDLPADTDGLCRCGGVCPSKVNPVFLTDAKGQELCSLTYQTGYKCSVACDHTDDDAVVKIRWFAAPCGDDGQEECDRPILANRKKTSPSPAVEAPRAPPAKKEDAAVNADDSKEDEEKKEGEKEEEKEEDVEEEKEDKEPVPAVAAGPHSLTWDPKEVYDLRGLKCQLKDGKEQCYLEDAQGRELCPDFVTHEYLNDPPDQWTCRIENAGHHFCTVGCQEGNQDIRWGAHEAAWCDKNKDNCPPRPSRE